MTERLGHALPAAEVEDASGHAPGDTLGDPLDDAPVATVAGEIVDEPGSGLETIRRLVVVDQKPIGRTPRSNLATYTGLFDYVRRLFAASPQAKARRYDAGRFSFNVAKGRCPKCESEGFAFVEFLFLPSVYAPCPACHGARYNDKTVEFKLGGKSIADVLNMTVDAAHAFFQQEPALAHSLETLRNVGLLPAAGPARHRAVGRRGPAHQARHRAAARPARTVRDVINQSPGEYLIAIFGVTARAGKRTVGRFGMAVVPTWWKPRTDHDGSLQAGWCRPWEGKKA